MKTLTEEIKAELRTMIFEYFADECETDIDELSDETNVMDELDADSLMVVELIEAAKKKYDLNIKLQTVGKFLLKNPAETLGEIVDLFNKLYIYEDDIINEA